MKALVLHLADIGAGGKGLVAARNNHAANGGIFLKIRKGVVELINQLGVQGIQRLGPVEGDDPHGIPGFADDVFIGHWHFLFLAGRTVKG